MTVNLVATDSPVGEEEYSIVDSAEAGDPIPVGMAEYLYGKLSVLGYDGQLVTIEDELTGAVGIGNTLNLSGGRVEWATMLAVVQQITENIDTGRTQISFGPPRHLGIPDLVNLLKVGRTRRRYSREATQIDGEIGNAAEVEFGDVTANDHAQGGASEYKALTIRDTTAAAATAQGSVKVSATDGQITAKHNTFVYVMQGNTGAVTQRVSMALADLPAGKEAKFRLTEVCVNGVVKTCHVLRTEEE